MFFVPCPQNPESKWFYSGENGWLSSGVFTYLYLLNQRFWADQLPQLFDITHLLVFLIFEDNLQQNKNVQQIKILMKTWNKKLNWNWSCRPKDFAQVWQDIKLHLDACRGVSENYKELTWWNKGWCLMVFRDNACFVSCVYYKWCRNYMHWKTAFVCMVHGSHGLRRARPRVWFPVQAHEFDRFPYISTFVMATNAY